MIRLGLTGGVGMGKSTVAGWLAADGMCVADTDVIARAVVTPGSPALSEIRLRLGREFILPDGNLDRSAMAARVFSDVAARRELEAILHPRIREVWQAQVANWQVAGVALAVIVIPLLYETRAEAELDRVVCVACSAPTQRVRLGARGWSDREIELRNAAQLPVGEKLRRANHVIWSEGDLTATRAQVQHLAARFR